MLTVNLGISLEKPESSYLVQVSEDIFSTRPLRKREITTSATLVGNGVWFASVIWFVSEIFKRKMFKVERE